MPAELLQSLQQQDPQMYALLVGDRRRQETTLRMTPSENHASLAVRMVLATGTGDNYAEGGPGRRYYQGQEFNDLIEVLTQERMMQLFGTPHANVQPYSGSPANLAVYKGLLQNGDTVMGLRLDAGGHLTHGAEVSVTGQDYRSVSYYVGEDGYIDYGQLADQVLKERPRLIIAGTTAYPRLLEWDKFRQIADSAGAYLMADIAHVAGLVAGESYPSPVPFADVVTLTGHKTLRGPRCGVVMVTEVGLAKDAEMAKKIDKAVFPGLQGGPHINTIAALGVAAQEASTVQFRRYAQQVISNAKKLAETLMLNDVNLVTGGTDSHLMLIDLRDKGLLGNTVAEGLEAAGIVANRNSIPHDSHSSFYPAGLRIGTTATTSRGMGTDKMELIADWITEIIDDLSRSKKSLNLSEVDERKRVSREAIIAGAGSIPEISRLVLQLCHQFPIPDSYV